MSRIDTWTPRQRRFSPLYRTLDLASLDRQFWQTARRPKRAPAVQTIPFSVNHNLEMSVEMEIMGRRASGILDTTARVASIDAAYLRPSESRQSRKLRAAATNIETAVQRVAIPSITLAGHTYTDTPAVLFNHRHQPQQQNTFPTRFLNGRVLDFDFPNQILRVCADTPHSGSQQPHAVLGYAVRQGGIFMPVKINGIAGEAIIDTSASHSSVNSAFIQPAKLDVSPCETTQIKGKYQVNLQNLRLGDFLSHDLSVALAESPIATHPSADETPLMRIGLDVLQHCRLQIDRTTQRVYLLRPEPKSSRAPLCVCSDP